MTSPFSKDYKPSEASEAARKRDSQNAAIGRRTAKNREVGMASDDPHVRLAASGYLGEMSTGMNHKLAKNSKLG